MTDDARAYKGAALQALTSLGKAHETIKREMQSLSEVLEQAASPDVMLVDPDSPVNVMDTLIATRAELAAARVALEPFARAYTRNMAQLGDLEVQVFVDPQRPEKARSIKLSNLREANRVFVSLSLGVETVARMRQMETLARDLVATVQLMLPWLDDAAKEAPERGPVHDVLARASKLLP